MANATLPLCDVVVEYRDADDNITFADLYKVSDQEVTDQLMRLTHGDEYISRGAGTRHRVIVSDYEQGFRRVVVEDVPITD